jgi:hypothetical protein
MFTNLHQRFRYFRYFRYNTQSAASRSNETYHSNRTHVRDSATATTAWQPEKDAAFPIVPPSTLGMRRQGSKDQTAVFTMPQLLTRNLAQSVSPTSKHTSNKTARQKETFFNIATTWPRTFASKYESSNHNPHPTKNARHLS